MTNSEADPPILQAIRAAMVAASCRLWAVREPRAAAGLLRCADARSDAARGYLNEVCRRNRAEGEDA
jgi:hypothetical protein